MKKVGTVLIIVLIFIFGAIAYNYIDYRSKNAVSDAAFVRTDSLLNLSFKVGGKVTTLTKKEGQKVKKGEVLAKIDTKDFLVEKERLINEIKSLSAKKEALEIKKEKIAKQIEVKLDLLNNKEAKLKPNIEALEFNINALRANFEKIKKDLKRFKALYSKKLVQKEKLDAINSKYKELKSKILAQSAKLKALKLDFKDIKDNKRLLLIEKKTIKELQKEIISLAKKIDSLKSSLKGVENKISYASLYCPIDGVIAKKFINVDRVVGKGSLIYSVVDPKDLHIEVLLSEKKLHGIKVNSSVKIEVDAIKDKEFKGKVESILPASAATFALVPRDIASGEFTKLDQRFVVRITLLEYDSRLRVGMGAKVAIKRDK